jgi:hypothetical protein
MRLFGSRVHALVALLVRVHPRARGVARREGPPAGCITPWSDSCSTHRMFTALQMLRVVRGVKRIV